MRDSCHVQCSWGRAHHSLVGAAGKLFHVCHFLQVYNSGWCSSLYFFFFFSGSHSVSAGAGFVLLSQGGDKDRWAPHLSGTRKVLFAQGLHFLPALYNCGCPLGRRSSPQGLGHRQHQPDPWLCFSQRITDISLALTRIKCKYSEQNAARLLCVLTKELSLRSLLFLLHPQLLLQFYLFFTLQKVNSHKYLNSKKPCIFCWNELVFKYNKSVIS